MPESFRWDAQRWKIETGEEVGMAKLDSPEGVIREYHESMIHNILPHTRPKSGIEDYPKEPAAGLLVRLVSGGSGKEVCFAWKEMKKVIEAERVRKLDMILECRILEETLMRAEEEELRLASEDKEEPEAAEEKPWEDSDVFRSSAKPPTQMDVADAPFWLMPVLHRWYRLHDFEMVALKHSPVFPVLSPLVLEAALTMPCAGLKDMPFEGYRAIGRKVTGLIRAVTTHARMPGGQHVQILQMMVDMLSREKLANLVWNAFPTQMLANAVSEIGIRLWAPPGTRSHQERVVTKIPNNDDLADIAEAFVGAYFVSEGSLFSVCQFLSWLQQESGEEEKPKAWENAVIGHLLCGSGHVFRGRTTSYLEFQEIAVGTDKILKVKYVEAGKPFWIEYRRSDPRPNHRKFPEERRGGGSQVRGSSWATRTSTRHSSLCKTPRHHFRTRYPIGFSENRFVHWRQ
jgi:hypothetical protein